MTTLTRFEITKLSMAKTSATTLETALFPLICDLPQDNVTSQCFNNSFEKLVNSITQLIKKHAPLQIASRRQKRIQEKPWLNKILLKMIKLNQKLYKSHFLSGSKSDKLYFKQFTNKLTRMKTLSKKAFYYSAVSERKTIRSNYANL